METTKYNNKNLTDLRAPRWLSGQRSKDDSGFILSPPGFSPGIGQMLLLLTKLQLKTDWPISLKCRAC